ncbi:hypothetical protein ACLOJK_025977 [Asimina triloba]
MEAAEVEDDAFFADLSKRISLLIMDDDDHDASSSHNACCCPSVSSQAFSHVYRGPLAAPPMVYEANVTRARQGTGVFIPRSIPRKKSRSGRFTSSHHAKHHKHSDKQPRISNL